MRRPRFTRLLRWLAAGALLALLELGLVLATERDLFLSNRELLRYALFACTALPALCALTGELGYELVALLARGIEPGGPRHARRVRIAAALVSWPLLALVLQAASSGRHLRALPWRDALITAGSGVLAWLVSGVLAKLLRVRADSPARARLAFGFALLAAAALVVDMYAFRRLYVGLHDALAAAAVGGAALAAALSPAPHGRLHDDPRLARLTMLFTALAAFALGLSLRHAPNARFAVAQAAPLSGKLLTVLSAARPVGTAVPATPQTAGAAAHAPTAVPAAGASAGLDLRGQDVLLVTIDALRADCLAAYGGSGLTPQLDAFARDAAVFARAYTPTPHTSYAVSSLMTGKFMQPLLALSGGAVSADHPTLPELLRHNGYRTAAFYPPAIFFVDQERFAAFESRQLGFEYVKAQFAPVDRQVMLVQRYLDHAETGYPLFVWVHVFEPHEPYEPPPAFARGSSPRERYDGEVAAADAGVGALIAAFRRARPGATVIVSADHGEEHGEHGGHHHGTTLFDEQIRVPLLWSSPGRVTPHGIDTPVELVDIPTTLLSALGIPREARMRGDDLGPALAGAPAAEPRYAFSLIDSARMVTDGKRKLICGARECQLFDLQADPHERRDRVEEQPEQVAELRGAMDAFLASLPRVEALALDGGGSWPEALTRARLGDAAAAPELVPLLSSARVEVRAAAARMLGELGAASARTVLSGLRAHDPEPSVRAEAALAALRLGETEAREQVVSLLSAHASSGAAPALRGGAASDDAELVRRVALALAAVDDASGEPSLIAMAGDEGLDEPQRFAALRALAQVGGKASVKPLSALLASVRLRAEAARTLGAIGDRRALPALQRALEGERYPEARTPEARALLALGARQKASALVRRFLGTESSLNDGVAVLLESGALAQPSGAGADLRTSSNVQRGEWLCEPQGCRPLAGASIALPTRAAPSGAARVIVRAHVEGAARWLRIGDGRETLDGGKREVARGFASARGLVLPVEASEGVWLEAIAVVPVTEDIPPPEPEPWEPADAGVDGGIER